MTSMSVPTPTHIRVQRDATGAFVAAERSSVDVALILNGDALRVNVATVDEVSRVALRWVMPISPTALVLGDSWERTYGDVEWRHLRPERAMPWSALVTSESGVTQGFGVEVRAGAFAFWQVDRLGVTLTLDLRNGGNPVRPGDRAIHAATIRWIESEAGAFAAQRELMQALCSDPLPSPGPVVGANNWYYAYGKNFGMEAVMRDARMISDLADGHAVRPFGVIDDGWSIAGTADGLAASPGPWDRGRPVEFPAMHEAAEAIRAEGVRPGVWYRPLLTRDESLPSLHGARDGAFALDPTAPGAIDLIASDMARISGWGFELIKHDFSTYDLLGQWGPDMGVAPGAGPSLHDKSVTNAEALTSFYRTIHEASGDALILGCNVVGHLAAGLADVMRVGDDTSGLDWNRTRRVGINTLAFRLAQHNAFYTVDADCVPSTPNTDWALNRQFLDLIARSGTALFVSVDPATRSAEVDADLSAALRLALDGGVAGGIEPLDWMTSATPSSWRSGDATIEYSWLTPEGADPFEPFYGASPDPAA